MTQGWEEIGSHRERERKREGDRGGLIMSAGGVIAGDAVWHVPDDVAKRDGLFIYLNLNKYIYF